MARYIDADALKEALKQNLPQYMWGEMFVTVNIQPSIDIVRCRECKYCVDAGAQRALVCDNSYTDMDIHPDGFCSYGERKESE